MGPFYTNNTAHSTRFLQKVILPLGILIPLFLLTEYLLYLFGLPGPISLFSLNASFSFTMNFVQLFTYPLAFGQPGEEIGLYWLLRFSFFLYLFWTAGTAILEQKGWRTLTALYCIGSVFAAFAALAVAKIGGMPLFYGGPAPFFLSILLFWTMLAPELTVWIFFFFPIRAKWGALFILTLSLLKASSFPIFVLLSTSILSTWVYALAACGLRLPFAAADKLETRILELFSQLNPYFEKKEKIISFRTLQNKRKEEEFFNKILEKIAREGKKSLSLYERWKIKFSSRRKKRPTS